MPVLRIPEVPITQFPWRESRILVSPERFNSQHMFVSLNELFPGAAHETTPTRWTNCLSSWKGRGFMKKEEGSTPSDPCPPYTSPGGLCTGPRALGKLA